MKDNGGDFKQLNRQEFAAALKKGLGRAFIHVARLGLADVADLVMEACLHDQAYDPQVERTKSKWLLAMFKDSSHYGVFSKRIIEALRTEREYWDVQQLFEIAREMAISGNELARKAVIERAIEQASHPSADDQLGAYEFVDLEGTSGVLQLARIYGQRLLRNPKDIIPGDLSFYDLALTREGKKTLSEVARIDHRVRAYWDHLEVTGVLDETFEKPTASRSERFRKEYPLSRIMKDAEERKRNFPGLYGTFGRYATKEELAIVYSRLLEEKSRAVRLRLLWVFSRTPIPELNDIVLKWAGGGDLRMREASLAAMAQVKDARIHELARRRVSAGQLLGPDTAVLRFFINNFGDDDADMIARALLDLSPNDEDAHDLVWGLADIAERNKEPALREALRWGYEVSPCSAHRYDIVLRLDAIGQLTGDILRECEFDANTDIADLARQRLS